MEQKENITYTTILHTIRKQFSLSLMDYCVADVIYHLSNNPASKVKGWCYASKEKMADILDATRPTIFRSIDNLIKSGFLEKDNDTKYLKTTSKWYENVVLTRSKLEYKETLHPVKKLYSKESRNFTPDSKETLHNNNIYNNKDNNIDLSKISQKELRKMVQ